MTLGDKQRLGVNIDHVATLRNARGVAWPDQLSLSLQARKQEGQSLEAAARVSGAGLAMTIRRIVLPMIAPHLAVARRCSNDLRA